MSVMSNSFHITGNTRDDQSWQSMLCFNKPKNAYMSSVGIASHGLSVKCHEYCLQTTAIPGLSL